MPGNPREIVTMAERRFPVRIRIGVPLNGFGQRYTEIMEWLDGNCGADGWAITPSGMRGLLTMPFRSISSTPRWRARSSPSGARRRGSRRMAGCSTFVTMSWRRGLAQGCTERPDIQRTSGRIVTASCPLPLTCGPNLDPNAVLPGETRRDWIGLLVRC
jgi:hypothetical protein